jgi:hypothetical protein
VRTFAPPSTARLSVVAGSRFQPPEIFLALVAARGVGMPPVAKHHSPFLSAFAAAQSAGLLAGTYTSTPQAWTDRLDAASPAGVHLVPEAAGVFTVGVTVAWIASGGTFPFGPADKHDAAFGSAAASPHYPAWPAPARAGVSHPVHAHLAASMLAMDPDARPTWQHVRTHPYFGDVGTYCTALRKLKVAVLTRALPAHVETLLSDSLADILDPAARPWWTQLPPNFYEEVVKPSGRTRPEKSTLLGILVFVLNALSGEAPRIKTVEFASNSFCVALICGWWRARTLSLQNAQTALAALSTL